MYTYMWINVYICMDVYMPDVRNSEEKVNINQIKPKKLKKH